MVILISAPSCSGKTFLSQKLLEIYKFPYYSIDHIKMGIYRSNLENQFSPGDSEEKVAKHIWPTIREIIKTAIENNQNLIVEGVYIYPKFLKEFDANYRDSIIPIFFAFSTKYISNNFQKNIIEYRNIIESRLEKENRNIDYFKSVHKKFIKKCKKNNQKCFVVDNSYKEMISDIINYIFIKIKSHKKNPIL